MKARDGVVIAVATDGDEEIAADLVNSLPPRVGWRQPPLNGLPPQFLAYRQGVLRGCDLD